MDEVTAKRAVEPFFSTKGIGRGTRLGLSMVHGLTAQLGGALTIDSTPGRGTTIELWLPVSLAPVDDEDAPAAESKVRQGRGKALLVDDEELVRMSTADMLVDLGFASSRRVRRKGRCNWSRRARPLICSSHHLMPGMSGADLARKLRESSKDLPVLIVSGYADADGIAPDLLRLTKPFRNAELAASLAALMPATAR